jgi:signal transduction histidine kinase
MFSVVLENTSFYVLTKVFPDRKIYLTRRLKLELTFSIAVMAISLSPLLFSDFTIGADGSLSPVPGPGMVFFLLHVVWFVAGGLLSLFKKFLKKSGIEKAQIKSLLIGGAILYALIPLSNFIMPLIFKMSNLVALSSAYTTIFAVIIGYSIIKQRLFDVRLAIVRTLTYVLSLGLLGGAYYLIAFGLSSVFMSDQEIIGRSPLNIGLALLLAFFFQPVKKFFDRVTNHFFYKDNYNTDDFFAKLNKILGFTTDLRGLLERTATEIARTLKGEQAIFFINTDEGHFTTAGTLKHRQLSKSDIDQLAGVPIGKTGLIIASLMDDNDPIKRMMISHRIELALPLVQDNKPIGYLFLGDHLTSNYNNRDIKVLNTISNELIIAIQNALAVQEIREFNVTLQQRIANATRELRASNAQLRHLDKAKDEFLSMASHQLRTPLTSVKGYISMIMDGDVGRVSVDQKKLLGEAFNNSERMVGLINDFLSVSRIQTGRFVIDKVPIDLSLVVEQEVDSLRANANARQMELVYNKPDDCPIMDIDEGKIRQVIMNFIDNAIYYSHPNTKININLSVTKGEILFTVNDTGIGVPKAERDQLFTKFYRASNAKKTRPDGTGVGLFLAKKVVDGHDGDVVFDSVEGKGSTFGFKLPIKPLVAAGDTNDLKN